MTRATKSDPYPFSMTVGAQLRETKEKRRLSDNQFSKSAGISRRHLVEAQKGANVSLHVTFRAMAALGLTELTHEFDDGAYTLKLKHAPSAGDAATRLEAAVKLEDAIALLAECVALLRTARPGDSPSQQPAEAPPATGRKSRGARAAALVNDFLRRLHDLDPDTQVDVLQHLGKAAVAPQTAQKETRAADQATARKRRTKTR